MNSLLQSSYRVVNKLKPGVGSKGFRCEERRQRSEISRLSSAMLSPHLRKSNFLCSGPVIFHEVRRKRAAVAFADDVTPGTSHKMPVGIEVWYL